MPIQPDSRPVLPRHIKLRFDKARDSWVLLSPERALVLDEIGADILQRVDGKASVSQIAAQLAAEYDAPPADIAADVTAFLQDLADKRLLEG
ncbi:MAG: pyrroloquinoline quinone biosynthesis peptide chaperone PqqD [Sneathiellaceae bacterium]